jgi:hypothetical protein
MISNAEKPDDRLAFLEHVISQRLQLLWFIDHCFANNRPVPTWAKTAFQSAFAPGWRLEIRPGNKQTGITAGKVMAVYERLQELRYTEGQAKNKTPFEIVGQEFGIEAPLAAQMYYVVAKNIVEHFESSGNDITDPGIMPSLRMNYEKSGNCGYLFYALDVCCQDGLMIPAWLAEAFSRVWEPKVAVEARSWDAIFGKPLPKGAQPAAMERRWKLQKKIFERVEELSKSKRSITKILFADVGDEFKVSGGYAERLYYAEKKARAAIEDM